MRTTTGTAGYGEGADKLARQYESVSFSEVHSETIHLFPAKPSRILDIGAGTGRDAAALADLGHTVVAAEPTPELRAHAQRLHPVQDIDWVDDALPELPALSGRGERFDLILLTAVWMHLDRVQRRSAMERMAALLVPGGRVVMSLRHGPVPVGRRMFDVSAEETIALAADFGLEVVHHSGGADHLGRGEVRWSYLGLQRCEG